MIELKEEINKITINSFYSFWQKTKTNNALAFDSWNQGTLAKYYLLPLGKTHIGIPKVQDISEEHQPFINLFSGNAFGNKEVQLCVDSTLQEEFYRFWKKQFPMPLKETFFLISGKLVPLHHALNVLFNEPEDFIKQCLSTKYTVTGIPDHLSLRRVLDTIFSQQNRHLSTEQKIACTLAYCTNHKILFKRIEAQNILYDFIRDYPESKNCFSKYQQDISHDENHNIF